MRQIFKLAVLSYLLLLAACVYGPKVERKSTLSYLSGENYETSPEPPKLLVPMAKRTEKLTRISGRVYLREGLTEIPVKNTELQVYDSNGKVLASSRTDLNGDFTIAERLHNGKYQIKLISAKLRAERSIDISTYEITDLKIEAQLKPE